MRHVASIPGPTYSPPGGLVRTRQFAHSRTLLSMTARADRSSLPTRVEDLIVWAIAGGRSTAAAVDQYLVGDTAFPTIIAATDRELGCVVGLA